MKLFGKTSTLIAGSLAAVCAAGAVAAYTAYQKKTEEVVELQERLDKLAKKETRSAIMQSVKSIDIPNSVTTIYNRAFYNNYGLTSVSLSNTHSLWQSL